MNMYMINYKNLLKPQFILDFVSAFRIGTDKLKMH